METKQTQKTHARSNPIGPNRGRVGEGWVGGGQPRLPGWTPFLASLSRKHVGTAFLLPPRLLLFGGGSLLLDGTGWPPPPFWWDCLTSPALAGVAQLNYIINSIKLRI